MRVKTTKADRRGPKSSDLLSRCNLPKEQQTSPVAGIWLLRDRHRTSAPYTQAAQHHLLSALSPVALPSFGKPNGSGIKIKALAQQRQCIQKVRKGLSLGMKLS